MELKNYIQQKKSRGDCYKLLAACFYMPQKKLFEKENLFANLNTLIEAVCPEALKHSSEMEKAVTKCTDKDLSIEYARLFVGPYKLEAPPYGSIYMDTGKSVMGDSTMEVLKIYNREGLIISDDFKELPDHIAVELEFMYYLVYRELKELEKSRYEKALYYIKTQEHFLNSFLVRWVPLFCEKIKEGTDNEFYRALAGCLSSIVMETDFIKQVPELLNRETAQA